ncbi:MAG: zinc-dependent metalloprotease [Pirellulales bacterium]|nr:zinc-dependent metalloprotease [Pirellulales bacterium]
MSKSIITAAFSAIFAISGAMAVVRADQDTGPVKPQPGEKAKESSPAGAVVVPGGPSPQQPSASSSASAQAKPKYPPFSDVLGDAKAMEGVIKLYRKESRLFAELTPGELNRDFIVAIALARGIAEKPLLGGMTLGGGSDDWVWQFRKVEDRIQIVRRNVRFRANKGTPTEKAVYFAYTDSILFSLPIATQGPSGGAVIDLTPVFMSDLAQISSILRGFSFAADRSTWASIKNYKDNAELEVAATFASGGQATMDTVPDSRGVTINIHYSISKLPETGYQPRLADDRVGYFLSVIKDFSRPGGEDQFVRYINRWDLRKAEPKEALSPPVTPIVFWIEKTVPFKYRGAIREGILEWNKAYEKAGFANAIEVRQQPDDAAWEPEDINYNTFRWITSNAGFAMGPSRVNPTNGQILDADIIFDADFVDTWMKKFEITPPPMSAVTVKPGSDAAEHFLRLGEHPFLNASNRPYFYEDARELSAQLALGSVALAAANKAASKEQIEKLIYQGVRSIATHEVGHTLGLRHNFKASTYLTLEEINNPEKTRQAGMASSVMDYLPLNLAPKGQKQGDYFDLALGPYDLWAIEYGYKPITGSTEGDAAELAKIASRSADPSLDYATDEDTRGSDADPLSNRFDLGKDPLAFAAQRMQVVGELLPTLAESTVDAGEGYQNVRRSFGLLMNEYNRALGFVARNVGGIYMHRDHKGDANARPPFVPVEPQKQRDSLNFLARNVFGPEAYSIPPQLFNYMAGEHWEHWGNEMPSRKELDVPTLILSWQERILEQLLAPLTLSRIADTEFKTPREQDAFTNKELLTGLTASIFQETEKLQEGKFTDRAPAIGPARRNLQRKYFEELADLAMGNSGGGMTITIGPHGGMSIGAGTKVPSQCQGVAAAELEALSGRIDGVLKGKAELDNYTRFHLAEIQKRIQKVLDARLSLANP